MPCLFAKCKQVPWRGQALDEAAAKRGQSASGTRARGSWACRRKDGTVMLLAIGPRPPLRGTLARALPGHLVAASLSMEETPQPSRAGVLLALFAVYMIWVSPTWPES